jgi:hypothetical protein
MRRWDKCEDLALCSPTAVAAALAMAVGGVGRVWDVECEPGRDVKASRRGDLGSRTGPPDAADVVCDCDCDWGGRPVRRQSPLGVRRGGEVPATMTTMTRTSSERSQGMS